MNTDDKKKPKRKTGLSRIIHASLNSIYGLKIAIKNESAFRQELLLFCVLLVVLYFLPLPLEFKIILFFANSLVLIVELLNSAVETVVDLVTPEYHELARHSKDLGSAAVLISLLLAGIVWGIALVRVLI